MEKGQGGLALGSSPPRPPPAASSGWGWGVGRQRAGWASIGNTCGGPRAPRRPAAPSPTDGSGVTNARGLALRWTDARLRAGGARFPGGGALELRPPRAQRLLRPE